MLVCVIFSQIGVQDEEFSTSKKRKIALEDATSDFVADVVKNNTKTQATMSTLEYIGTKAFVEETNNSLTSR